MTMTAGLAGAMDTTFGQTKYEDENTRSGMMKKIDTQKILLEEENISDEKFEERNLLNIISVGIFLVGGPLFI